MTDEEKKWLHTIRELSSCNNLTPDVELNNWEEGFIKSLEEHYDLSQKQHDCLKKIYNKF